LARSWSSIRDLVRQRADEAPDWTVFTFVDPAREDRPSLTVGGLDLQARSLAAEIADRIAPGERALLLYPPGLPFIAAFFACAYAGVIAVPAAPPDPRRLDRALARLRAVVADAAPALVLTTGDILTAYQAEIGAVGAAGGGAVAAAPELAALPWWATGAPEALGTAHAADWRPRAGAAPADLAYLQYTSGSTSTPKGVMVSHANAAANSASIQRAWGYDRGSVALMWVPHFHDDGLVHGVLQPLHAGCRSYLLPPLAVAERPARWLAAVGTVGATHSGGPNFAYELCARRIAESERAGLDLASWRVAYNAAEPVRAETIDLFCRTFAPHGFRRAAFHPAFGLAEATLLVTAKRSGDPALLAVAAEPLASAGRALAAAPGEAARILVGCGAAVPGTRVVVASPDSGAACAPREVGEIWIAGPAVAQGYWRQPEATAATFAARLDSGDGPFLRTGDLGFLDESGELVVTGRLKDLVIIHGRNHYPQDIELTVERTGPPLRSGCVAAIALDTAGGERLAVVCEADDRASLDLDALGDRLSRDVWAAHEIELHLLVLVRPRSIAKTSSGKIQRGRCRAELAAGQLSEIGRWTAGRPAALTPATPATPSWATGTAAEPAAAAAGAAPAPAHAASAVPVAAAATQPLAEPAATVAWLRAWAPERLDSRLADERRTLPPHVLLDLGNRGLCGLQLGPTLGGLGLSHRGASRVLEQLGAIDLTVGCLIAGHNSLGLRPLLRWAAPAWRNELLPDLARGRALAAFALTEPGTAGSHPRGLTTLAFPAAADRWRLTGTKCWIGSAAWARVLYTFARIPRTPNHPGGITGFLVRQGAPGLEIGPEALTMGLRAMVQSEVRFTGVEVGAADLLGEPCGGLEVADDAIALSRCFLAAVALGGVRRACQMAVRFAGRRAMAGRRLLDQTVTRARLGAATAAATALESLLATVTAALDAGQPPPPEVSALLKTAAAEVLWQAADVAMQLLGGRGYVETNLVPQLLRDARAFRIFEGPSEALLSFAGSSILAGGEPLGFLRALPLGGPVAARLAAVAGEVRERIAARLPAEDPVAVLAWGRHLMGKLAVAALLLAATDSVAAGASPAHRRAAAWAAARFDEQARRALAGDAAERAFLVAADVDLLEGELAAAIGDGEPQARTGAAPALDPLLWPAATARIAAAAAAAPLDPPTARTAGPSAALPATNAGPPAALPVRIAGSPAALAATAPPGAAPSIRAPSPMPPPSRAAAAPGPPRRGAAEIRDWIGSWLAHETAIATDAIGATDAIDADRPFSAFGLDSVGALRLAADLAGWLGQPVPRTAAWDFPSPQSLAHHLGGAPAGADVPSYPGAAAAAATALAADDLADLLPALDAVEALTPEEARRALAEERRPHAVPHG
jgi:acyl-CoA synthetase (AMP-forming)/AMP-acid ligase II/alkylation response protein AidB-like acyl-CoA dehydrogenase/acyl carrier protein